MNDSLLQLLKLWDLGPTAVALMTLAVAIAPKLLAAFTDWSDRHRNQAHSKDYLQILKLRCEIQSLIQSNQLDAALFALPPLPPLRAYVPPPLLTRKEKFWATCLGALSPTLLYVFYSAFMSMATGAAFIWTMVSVALILSVCSTAIGLMSLVTPLRRAWHAYLFGFSIPIVLILGFKVIVLNSLGSGAFGG